MEVPSFRQQTGPPACPFHFWFLSEKIYVTQCIIYVYTNLLQQLFPYVSCSLL